MTAGTARTPTPSQRAAAQLALRMNNDIGRPTSARVRAIAAQEAESERTEPGAQDR